MRIAILGGTGQIGALLTKELLKAFPTAEILSCSRSGGDQKHQHRFNVYQEDWSSLGKLDVIVNSVGIIEEKGENTFEKAHIGVVKNIIQHRSSIGNPKIIHLSVLGADPASPSRYASTKGEADILLQQQENWMIIRPSFVCTPGTAIIQKIELLHTTSKWFLSLLPIPAHFLQAEFQPVMGEDIADVIIEAIKNDLKNKIVYATGPEKYFLQDWIKIKGKGKTKILPIPKWIVDRPFRLIIKIFPQIMNTDQYLLLGEDNTHDYEVMKEILGREPRSTAKFWLEELQ